MHGSILGHRNIFYGRTGLDYDKTRAGIGTLVSLYVDKDFGAGRRPVGSGHRDPVFAGVGSICSPAVLAVVYYIEFEVAAVGVCHNGFGSDSHIGRSGGRRGSVVVVAAAGSEAAQGQERHEVIFESFHVKLGNFYIVGTQASGL